MRWADGWAATEIYEMGLLAAGNVIPGPAILEAPATTLVVPPDRIVELDEHGIFHLGQRSAS